MPELRQGCGGAVSCPTGAEMWTDVGGFVEVDGRDSRKVSCFTGGDGPTLCGMWTGHEWRLWDSGGLRWERNFDISQGNAFVAMVAEAARWGFRPDGADL